MKSFETIKLFQRFLPPTTRRRRTVAGSGASPSTSASGMITGTTTPTAPSRPSPVSGDTALTVTPSRIRNAPNTRIALTRRGRTGTRSGSRPSSCTKSVVTGTGSPATPVRKPSVHCHTTLTVTTP